jgi:hypothetical protein
MTKKTKTEEKKLYLPYELFGDELAGTGWSGLVTPIIRAVNTYNKDKEEDKRAVITQIKEKFAEARIYGYFPDEIQNMADIAERASYQICYECGSCFNVGQTENGWITTLCENCAKKQGHIENNNWKARYTSVKLDNFLNYYLKIRNEYWKFCKYLDEIHYKVFRRWKYKREKTFNFFKQLIFWKYVRYKKYDFIPLDVRRPNIGEEVYIKTSNKNWEGHYKGIMNWGGTWTVTYPTEWNFEKDGVVTHWRKIDK